MYLFGAQMAAAFFFYFHEFYEIDIVIDNIYYAKGSTPPAQQMVL